MTETMSTSQELADINVAADDELISVVMLSGLLSEYNPMIMALKSSGARIASNTVKSKLIQEDVKQWAEEWNQSSETALMSSTKAKKTTKIKKDVLCFNCNKVGHIKSECDKPKKGKAGAASGKGDSFTHCCVCMRQLGRMLHMTQEQRPI